MLKTSSSSLFKVHFRPSHHPHVTKYSDRNNFLIVPGDPGDHVQHLNARPFDVEYIYNHSLLLFTSAAVADVGHEIFSRPLDENTFLALRDRILFPPDKTSPSGANPSRFHALRASMLDDPP